jgi:hypothetical protein
VWPAALNPIATRLGYTTSAPIYLAAAEANGMLITVVTGEATVYAGGSVAPYDRTVVTLGTGQSARISGLAADEVLSVETGTEFTFTFERGTPPPHTPPCTDPLTCSEISSIRSRWVCNIPGCTSPDWIGGVISWPSWSAYESNARSGDQSRTVYAMTGEVLYPYMGAWASGCQVTALEGEVLIVEWQRSTNVWRSKILQPGQTHTIQLVSPEDNALIETPDTPTDFRISLANCTPQVIQK